MTIQLLPITGIPLPFISYGGSSLWSLMVGIGVVLSIHFHQRQTMPNKRRVWDINPREIASK